LDEVRGAEQLQPRRHLPLAARQEKQLWGQEHLLHGRQRAAGTQQFLEQGKDEGEEVAAAGQAVASAGTITTAAAIAASGLC
jgi:hypothetical protein